MEVCIVGAGSLGSLVGGLLAGVAEVTLVGREPHVGTVDREGLRLTGELDRHVYPKASTTPPPTTDLAIVTVKAYDTETAATALAGCDVGGALSLQNGLGNEAILAAHLDCEVLAGITTYGAHLVEPGVVRCTGRGDVACGPPDGGGSALADRVGELLASAGIEATVAPDMPRRLWEKLAINAGINPVTALARVPNGALVDDPPGGIARDAARETARVAQTVGVELDQEHAAEALVSVADATAANTSSMRTDIESGDRTEIDAINGAVVDRADGPVPVNETLAGLVRAWEAQRGLR